jgi:hypothetical protein
MEKQAMQSTELVPVPAVNPASQVRKELRCLIEVCGFDRGGRFFTEQTDTINVSAQRCSFALRTEIAPDAILAICLLSRWNRGRRDQAPELFQIERSKRSLNGWTIEALKLQRERT